MYSDKKVAVLIAAAGSGNRLNSDIPKQFLKIEGITMLEKTAMVFENSPLVDAIYVVAPEKGQELCKEILVNVSKFAGVTVGGRTRQDSVRKGLMFIDGNMKPADIVLIHDAARPFISDEVVERVIESASHHGAAVPCVPVVDTVYNGEEIVGEHGEDYWVLSTLTDRSKLYSVQTPQGFFYDIIMRAHDAAEARSNEATDDGSLVKRLGINVRLVEGAQENYKITTAKDLLGSEVRVGIGFDVHAFAEGRPLIIGGVEVPNARGLMGHSDADVLTHAIMDAMLGALSLGDIGMHFPDTDLAYAGISSMKLLGNVLTMIRKKGFEIFNIDTVIVAERPRMAGFIPSIKSSLAEALGVPEDCIGVKATTTEGLGFTGREEGIGAQAVVQLKRIA
jgi:2-C-methyl-D-erythritol 4-phosphate cytidylyltransferase/2-C-methyl-D-erythritol 2,4-cyclodiphosphate synthase